MSSPPTVTLPNGDEAEIHVMVEDGECEYDAIVAEGIAGYVAPDGSHVSVAFRKPTGTDADDETDDDGPDYPTSAYLRTGRGDGE